MTLLEYVELPMRFAELERGSRQSLAREVLKRVGSGARLAHRAECYPLEASSSAPPSPAPW